MLSIFSKLLFFFIYFLSIFVFFERKCIFVVVDRLFLIVILILGLNLLYMVFMM